MWQGYYKNISTKLAFLTLFRSLGARVLVLVVQGAKVLVLVVQGNTLKTTSSLEA
jgi:hypothetical protein